MSTIVNTVLYIAINVKGQKDENDLQQFYSGLPRMRQTEDSNNVTGVQ